MQKISFVNELGDKEDIELEDTTRINLNSKGISKIDLTQIRFHPCLRELYLADNKMTGIDLQPLSTAKNLQILDVSSNQLKKIDLSPLHSCTSLNYIDLSDTSMTRVDLSPLESCTNLQFLKMSMNRLRNVDLSPLSSCTNLHSIELFRNKLRKVDVTPLENCPAVETDRGTSSWVDWGLPSDATYERPSRTYPWTFLYQIAHRFGVDYRVQQDILLAMGLGDFGFVDINLRDIFLSIPQDSDLETARNIVICTLLKHLASSAESDITTTGLNLDKLSEKYPEVYQVYKNIVQLRKKELERVSVGVAHENSDFQELLLTAYGFEILSAIKKPTFEKIEEAFSELGYPLNTSEKLNPGVRMSDDLRKSILWIVENRGLPISDTPRTIQYDDNDIWDGAEY